MTIILDISIQESIHNNHVNFNKPLILMIIF